jgi:hypothetical protein
MFLKGHPRKPAKRVSCYLSSMGCWVCIFIPLNLSFFVCIMGPGVTITGRWFWELMCVWHSVHKMCLSGGFMTFNLSSETPQTWQSHEHLEDRSLHYRMAKCETVQGQRMNQRRAGGSCPSQRMEPWGGQGLLWSQAQVVFVELVHFWIQMQPGNLQEKCYFVLT